MIDAIGRLVRDGPICCSFSNLIVGKHKGDTGGQTDRDSDEDDDGTDNLDEDGLNPNQVRAVESSDNPLALIWGPPGTMRFPPNINDLIHNDPPGTGKTTVVVKILRKFFKALGEDEKILMTASTHNGASIFHTKHEFQYLNRVFLI